MRDDFKKVIHEAYRSGAETSTKVNKPRHAKRLRNKSENSDDKELFSKQESMSRKRRYGWDCKRKTHAHSPKVRFLNSRVGKPWDDIWAEISKAGVQNYFTYLVEINFNGFDSRGHPIDTCGYWIHSNFYVDDNGLLQKTPSFRRRQRKAVSKETNYIWLGRQLYGRRTDGLWYRLCLKRIPENNYQWVEELASWSGSARKTITVRRDLSDRPYCMWLLCGMYKASDGLINGWYCDHYEQVSKKELQQIKKALL